MKLLLLLNMFSQILVGNQRDEHGCILDGGYRWCDSLKKCIRPWDTSCPVKMCKDSDAQLCRMMCPPKECGKDECVKRIGSCCDFKCMGSSDNLNIGDICFQFCEDNSKPFINKRYECPKDTNCLPVDESIGFDSCGERAHKCVESH